MSRGFRPKSRSSSNPRPLLKDQLNLEHPLVKLSQAMDWDELERELGQQVSSEGGRPALPTRLLVGLHYLKALYDESDESVVGKWVENPYWQYFCGEETFQHEFPCHPTSLPKWRQRVGVEGVEKLLKQVLHTAMKLQALKPCEIAQVNVDTTVQEKAIAFPTDARLYDKARRALVLVTTHASNWIVGMDAVHGNPYDGATLKGALTQTERLTTIKPKQAAVDKGFRGVDYHPPDVEVVVAGTRKRQLTRTLKRLLKRRSAIEPVIGHTKQDHALKRNYLHGRNGDRINAFLAGCGFNLRKLFRFLLTTPLIQASAIA